MRFTLRDLFWLTLLVAVSLGWIVSTVSSHLLLRARGRHAEALRHALHDADANRGMYEMGGNLEHDSPLPVDRELATREIP